jgi:hypothetical protein
MLDDVANRRDTNGTGAEYAECDLMYRENVPDTISYTLPNPFPMVC